MGERYLWRGFLMCAVRGTSNTSVTIHLQDAYGGTLCGSHKPNEVIDDHAATGWPDCESCIKKADEARRQYI